MQTDTTHVNEDTLMDTISRSSTILWNFSSVSLLVEAIVTVVSGSAYPPPPCGVLLFVSLLMAVVAVLLMLTVDVVVEDVTTAEDVMIDCEEDVEAVDVDEEDFVPIGVEEVYLADWDINAVVVVLVNGNKGVEG